MIRSRRRWIVAGSAAFCSVILGACLASWRRPELSLAIVDWPAYEYFYLASRAGLDQRAGYSLRIKQFGSLRDQRLAYQRADVEAIATTLPEALAICREVPSRCPVLVLVLDQSNGADQLYARASITTLPQLKGQRVGLESGVLGEFILMRALQTAGLRLGDVDRQYAAPRVLVEELKRGELAAIVTYSPYSDVLQASARWRLLFSSRDIPGEVVDVLAVSPALQQSDPALVARLVNTWWLVRQYAAAHPAESLALMAQRQGVSPQQFQQSQLGIAYPSRAEQPRLLAAKGPIQATLERMRRQMGSAQRLPADLVMPRLQGDDQQ